MHLAIDLTPRQATRVLEQALRARAELEIEPRNLPEDVRLRGRLLGCEGELLAVQVADGKSAWPLSALIGAFCEVQTVLSGEMYRFTTCILDIVEDSAPTRLLLVIPETIQVLNRRQFERTNATVASQVRVWIPGQSSPAVGLLANVSADGLACNLPDPGLDQALALGDELRVCFELAGFDESFELPAVLCNKTLSRDQQQLALGLQFHLPAGDAAAQHAWERLRAALFTLMSSFETDGDL